MKLTYLPLHFFIPLFLEKPAPNDFLFIIKEILLFKLISSLINVKNPLFLDHHKL